jgi:hypothetical protein
MLHRKVLAMDLSLDHTDRHTTIDLHATAAAAPRGEVSP